MSFSVFCSVGSLALGFMAWAIPCLTMDKIKNFCGLSKRLFFSFCCCIFALFLQFLEIEYRIKINDLTAVLDTLGATLVAESILIFGTMLLNGLAISFVWKECNKKVG